MSKITIDFTERKSAIYLLLVGCSVFSVLAMFILLVAGCNFNSDKSTNGKAEISIDEVGYIDRIKLSRNKKHIEFLDSTTSRFNKQERDSFHGFSYYEPDIRYRIEAQFVVDTTIPVFGMKTNTSRTPTYRTYGYLDFVINDINFRLTAFQNMDFKDDPEYDGSLFVPFTDISNKDETYKAGRYIDIPIPVTNRAMLDFNDAYNPYCAYSDRWSCPLVPFENHLNISIRAGEKIYK